MNLSNFDPKIGIVVENKKQLLLLWKYYYWQKGIPASVFKKELMQDLFDILDIKNAIESNNIRVQKI